MNLTEYGKTVRKLRIDHEVTLRDMAEELDVSPAYLSAVETGNRPVSSQLLSGVIDFFRNRGVDASVLSQAAAQSMTRVDVSERSAEQRAHIAILARRLPEFESSREWQDLIKLING